jgi:hypothetical protein
MCGAALPSTPIHRARRLWEGDATVDAAQRHEHSLLGDAPSQRMPTVGSHLPAGVVRLLYGAVECFLHSLSYLASVTLPVNLSGEVAWLSCSVEGVGPKPNPTTS